MNDAPTTELMTAFYAAVTAVEDGRVDEVELERRETVDGEDEPGERVLTIVVRREVKHLRVVNHPTGPGL